MNEWSFVFVDLVSYANRGSTVVTFESAPKFGGGTKVTGLQPCTGNWTLGPSDRIKLR